GARRGGGGQRHRRRRAQRRGVAVRVLSLHGGGARAGASADGLRRGGEDQLRRQVGGDLLDLEAGGQRGRGGARVRRAGAGVLVIEARGVGADDHGDRGDLRVARRIGVEAAHRRAAGEGDQNRRADVRG